MVAINSRTAIFGGTFDPIHRGHLHLLSEVIQRNLFKKIIVIPSGKPQLKLSPPQADSKSRLAMVKLAITELPIQVQEKIEVNTFELENNQNSYAIDTVAHLKSVSTDAFTWILGSDAALNLPKWHRFSELSQLVDFLVILRPGSTFTPISGANLTSLEIDALQLSSTEIRNTIFTGKEVTSAVPDLVLQYIKRNGLYASA